MRLTPFAARVLAVVRRIPRGSVLTYGEVAVRAGRPGAARAVGTVLRVHGRGRAPCHRVVGAHGRLGGFGGQELVKRALLIEEGLEMRGGRVFAVAPAPATDAPRRARRDSEAKERYNQKR